MQVPWDRLEPETLTNLIEEFVTRDGTDYGTHEASVAAKVAQVRRQLQRGEAVIVFDEETETCNIVLARDAGPRQNP
jgi:uncharacterized protein YheU (UPF0270 family)